MTGHRNAVLAVHRDSSSYVANDEGIPTRQVQARDKLNPGKVLQQFNFQGREIPIDALSFSMIIRRTSLSSRALKPRFHVNATGRSQNFASGALPSNVDVDRLGAVEAVEEEPVGSGNASNPRHMLSGADDLIVIQSCQVPLTA